MKPEGFCSYEELGHIVETLTADSTTPVDAKSLNPLIETFLVKCQATIRAIGGHSVLLSTCEGIAAKISFGAGDPRLGIEQDVFSRIQKCGSPYIVRCFLSGPDITFMPFISDRNLPERITMDKSPRPVLPWMFQLSSAIATLESLGLAHGDIKPQNILVDEKDRLTLIDMDHALPIGSDLEVGDEPYVRVHMQRNDEDWGGVYGQAGPKTEQFALGSIFWYMTRGVELYADMDGFERVNRLMRLQLPDLTESHDPIDHLICDCWSGKFEKVADLVLEIKRIAERQGIPDSVSDAEPMSSDEYLAKRELCNQYYRSLLLGETITKSPKQSPGELQTTQDGYSTYLRWRERIFGSIHYFKKSCQSDPLLQPILAITLTAGAAMVFAAYLRRRC